jgi:hypothetical protein
VGIMYKCPLCNVQQSIFNFSKEQRSSGDGWCRSCEEKGRKVKSNDKVEEIIDLRKSERRFGAIASSPAIVDKGPVSTLRAGERLAMMRKMNELREQDLKRAMNMSVRRFGSTSRDFFSTGRAVVKNELLIKKLSIV